MNENSVEETFSVRIFHLKHKHQCSNLFTFCTGLSFSNIQGHHHYHHSYHHQRHCHTSAHVCLQCSHSAVCIWRHGMVNSTIIVDCLNKSLLHLIYLVFTFYIINLFCVCLIRCDGMTIQSSLQN